MLEDWNEPPYDKTNKMTVCPAKTQITQADLSKMGADAILLSFVMRRLKLTLPWNHYYDCKWAATQQNQQSDCAPSEDSDQPGHEESLGR